MILFLHFLVMTSALFCLSSLYKVGHALENFIGPSQVLQHKVLIVQLQKPMIQLILLLSPVSLLNILRFLFQPLHFHTGISFLRLFFIFLSGKSNMALFSEKRFEVVPWNDLLIFLESIIEVVGQSIRASMVLLDF